MSSCAFARASSFRTEDMTASLRALRSFVTMENRYRGYYQGRETETRVYLWVVPHQRKMSRCRQRERTSCLLFFCFLTVCVGKDDERSEMIQIQAQGT